MYALIDALRTIEALSLSSGSAFWIVKYAPLKLMSMIESKNSSVTDSNGTNLPTPALIKSTSILPNFSFTTANNLSMSVRLDASERTARTSPPSLRLASSSVCWSRPVITTRAPLDPTRVLEQPFQNNAKNLVEHRKRDLHHIFQRLAILCCFRHEY